MEPEVHLIEKYFQLHEKCFTMTNVRCKGGKEIDLLAINPKSGEKYHVESSVKPAFKLKVKTTYTKQGKSHRDGIDFFVDKKFNHPLVLGKIHEIFGDTNYRKWLVVWSVQDDSVFQEAETFGMHA
ncbi:MAG: hypothetical protein OEY40_02945 [Candidatus Bathyarchaeota archaeon]|nr:hypothetical protein [Candidatus Bathyarchaeota archaeon]